MCPPSIVFWCYILLLVTLSSESGRNSTNNDERDSTMQYNFFVNSVKDRDDKMQLILYNLRKNSTKNEMEYEMEYDTHVNSTNNDRMDSLRYDFHGHIMKIHKGNNQTSREPRANSTRDNYNDMITIISYEECGNETCIQLCCPFGDRQTSEMKCVAGQNNYSFPVVYQNENKKLNQLFHMTVRDPCVLQGSAHRIINPDEYSFLVNGSLYRDPDEVVPSTFYCLAVLDRNVYDVIVCMNQIGFPTYISVCLLVSLPFLLLTFVIYSILPEVQNVHSYTLRVHVASLFTTNVVVYCVQEIPELSEWKYCIPLAYIFNFSMLSGCFWLNATCFDIWWTFRKLNLFKPDVKKKKKTFMMYSIYAWGITFTLTIVCAIMDNVPGIPNDLIRPEMCKNKFWFGRDEALTVYFYAPTGTAFISNICFFVGTTLTILYHNKHTARQLRDSVNRRYEKKKRKFNMYLKLFIVMGVSWSMGIILWLINANSFVPQMVWNISYTIDILQGPIIFIIYVCKRKTLRLLLKRFGWQDRGLIWNNSSSNQRMSRTSSTMSYISSISGSMHMQRINSSLNHRAEHSKVT